MAVMDKGCIEIGNIITFYLKTRGLIVPDLYELNFMSLINFNSDEADFLSTLIYGEHREN